MWSQTLDMYLIYECSPWKTCMKLECEVIWKAKLAYLKWHLEVHMMMLKFNSNFCVVQSLVVNGVNIYIVEPKIDWSIMIHGQL